MGIVSLFPIFIAVGLALYTKRAIFSLFCGLLTASILINISAPHQGLFYLFDPLLISALADADSIKVIFFSMLIAIGVEIMRQSEGTNALVAFFLRYTKTRRRTQVATWLAGLTVFFDDYANCLIVGSSMQPVVDKARISREKLAYLVDSTAAPVATLALISTWIGYEVSLMDKALNQVEQIPYTIESQSDGVYICDPTHQWKNPTVLINDQSYVSTHINAGWYVALDKFPSQWSMQLKSNNQSSSMLEGKHIYAHGEFAFSFDGKNLHGCTHPISHQTPHWVTTIYPQKTEEKNLVVTLPNHPDLQIQTTSPTISKTLIGDNVVYTFAKASLLDIVQGEKHGSIMPQGWGSITLEWSDQGVRAEQQNAYSFFLAGLPYRFYPILALVFGFCIAVTGRDYGPMLKAEERALINPQEEAQDADFSWGIFSIAVIPLSILIGYTGFDLYMQGVEKIGSQAPLFEIIGEADGYQSMLKGAIAFSFSAALLAWIHKRSISMIQNSIVQGCTHLVEPLSILALAWALGNAIEELNAASFLVGLLQNTIPHFILPSIVFVLAAGISFATGTSFGTMGTLMPIALPLAIQLQVAPDICLATAAAVLSGATWGDHCSPISDTTILSSAGSGCDHISHVRTQLPYAIASGLISVLFCTLPVGLGMHWSVCLALGSIMCLGWILWRGSFPQIPHNTEEQNT